MNPIDLANTYVDKYLYGKNVNFDEMYNEILKPFSELSDKTSFLSYTSRRGNKHIEFLNDHIEELKKEKLQRELNRYVQGKSTFNYFMHQCLQIEEFYRE